MGKLTRMKFFYRRLGFTMFILLVYMLGCSVPIPFAKITRSAHQMINTSPLSVASLMSGVNLQHISLFTVGLNPLMIAMLFIQLFTMLRLFYFDSLSMPQMMTVQQVLTAILAAAQSFSVTVALHLTSGPFHIFVVTLILTAGSMFVVWLGVMNIQHGIGGTITIILFNIINLSLPNLIRSVRYLKQMPYANLWLLALVLFSLALGVFWIAFNRAYYPVQVVNYTMPSYTKPMVLPIGLNMGAMMTIMIGMAILMMPTMLGQYLGPKSIFSNITFDAVLGGSLTFLLFYFFTFVQFNPEEQAKKLRNENNYILNVRPGLPTQKYLSKRLWIIAFPGAVLNAVQLTFGLLAMPLLGKFAGFALIPMNILMIVMFMSGIKDQFMIMFFPNRYRKIMEEEKAKWII